MKFLIFTILLLVVVPFLSCKGDKNGETTRLSSDQTEEQSIEESKQELLDSTSERRLHSSFSNYVTTTKEDSVQLLDSSSESEKKSQLKEPSSNDKGNKEVERKGAKGQMSFAETTFDFGFIDMDVEIDHTFHFTNLGERELNISNAKASCGCTTPSYPFIPIMPGEKGKIDVHFSSKGRLGSQQAEITIYNDGVEPVKKLYLKGTVVAPLANTADDTSGQD